MKTLLSPADLEITLDNPGLGDYHKEAVSQLLYKIVPRHIYENESNAFDLERAIAHFLEENIPLIQWEANDNSQSFSVLMLCKYRMGASSFFYHMINRWLLPHKQIPIEVFFSADFSIPQICINTFSIAEVAFRCKDVEDWVQIKKNIQYIYTEIRLGVVSSFNANRILESKGLSFDGKTSLVQEKIGALAQQRGQDYDKSIFSQMQRFLVNCKEEFKSFRSYHHLSRIISIFYLLRKTLLSKLETYPKERHVITKFIKTKLSPNGKNVLGICVGINLVDKNELFGEENVLQAIRQHLPEAKIVEDSFVLEKVAGTSLQIVYAEIQKEINEPFSLDDVQLLRSALPASIKRHVHSLIHPIFMPRNEEEIYRNIMSLSKQLRFAKDIPQVMVSFDKQSSDSLDFTILILRVIKAKDLSISKLLQEKEGISWRVEKTKKVGLLRRKYAKEANIIRISVPCKKFLRSDSTVDYFKARKEIISFLIRSLGQIRDFNGGLLYKEGEALQQLKLGLGNIAFHHDITIEKFFYSIFPGQKRSVIDVDILKTSYLLALQQLKKNHFSSTRKEEILFKQEEKYAIALFVNSQLANNDSIIKLLDTQPFDPQQWVQFSIQENNIHVVGYILLSKDKHLQQHFFQLLEKSTGF